MITPQSNVNLVNKIHTKYHNLHWLSSREYISSWIRCISITGTILYKLLIFAHSLFMHITAVELQILPALVHSIPLDLFTSVLKHTIIFTLYFFGFHFWCLPITDWNYFSIKPFPEHFLRNWNTHPRLSLTCKVLHGELHPNNTSLSQNACLIQLSSP